MNNVGIFFGSDTGNTENVASLIRKEIGDSIADIFDIGKSTQNDLEKYDKLFLGIPTWYYGEAQCDWEDFFPVLNNINFNKKTVALFGCGDQEDYGEYFCDAIGILKNIIEPKGATIVGKWSTSGYNFKSSKGLINNDYFVGLTIDEDRQSELTLKRIKEWTNSVIKEMNII